MNGTAAYVRKQMITSIIISMAVSAAFFLLVFRMTDPIAIGAPDNLALDFLPHTGFASFLAAFIPALQTRAAMARGELPGKAPGVMSVLLRAILFAVIGLGFAGLIIAVLNASAIATFSWSTAFAIKIAYGALLGVIITPPAVRAVLAKG